MEPVAKSDRHRFCNQEVSSHAGAIRDGKSDAARTGTFFSPKGDRYCVNQKPNEGKSSRTGAEHSGKFGGQGQRAADRGMAHWRYLYRSGVETLVGINQKSAQSKRRVLDSCKKDGANRNPRRRGIARRRVTAGIQQGQAAEAANRGSRA